MQHPALQIDASHSQRDRSAWMLMSTTLDVGGAAVLAAIAIVAAFLEVVEALKHPLRSFELLSHDRWQFLNPVDALRRYLDVADTSGMDFSDEDLS